MRQVPQIKCFELILSFDKAFCSFNNWTDSKKKEN